jgi:hypothetical protein
MNINVIYGQGAANNAAPAGFYTAVNYVVNYFDSLFTNNVTVNINVSYGSILDPYTNRYSNVSSSDISESYTNNETIASYAAAKTVLLGENAPGASTLPSSSPDPGSLTIGSAEAKALGFIGASSTLDGSVGISSTSAWDFTPNTTPTANQYYLVGSLEHEITEVMGRESNLDTSGEYSVIDLYRYSAAGVRDLTTGGHGSTAYFSIDNGTTNLGTWNNQISNGDLADWYPQGPAPGGNDAFNDYSNSGVINVVSASDITLMEALGWTSSFTAPTVNVQNVSIAENTSVAATSFLTLSNPSGDNITQYTLVDNGTTGHFTVNGVIQPDGQAFSVSSLSTVQYVGGTLPGSDTIQVQFFDSTTNSESNFTSLTATTTASISVNNSITDLYIGYFDRAPDPSGETYWAAQLQGGMGIIQIAQSFSVQTESTNLYSFLAAPNTASTAAVKAFVDAIYLNLFNRAADAAGETYWIAQLQTGASTPGDAIINIISGAQANDTLTIDNKVTVGEYYYTQIFSHNVQFTTASAEAALSAVTFNASSIATAEAIVNSYVQTAPSAAQAATASQTEVNLVGISTGQDLTHAA